MSYSLTRRRTLSAVPFDIEPANSKYFLYLRIFIDYNNMKSILLYGNILLKLLLLKLKILNL